MKATLLVFAVAGATVLLTQEGCTTVNTVEVAQPVAQKKLLAEKVTYTDDVLSQRVKVLNVNFDVGPEGFMKIQCQVQNTTAKARAFAYRVEWFDDHGMIITLPSNTAVPRMLEAGETTVIVATAPTDKARDFRIKFMHSLR
jgi:uncharacterized protein YcfL